MQELSIGDTQHCGDAFHDGRKVLQSVLDWHNYLRTSSRKSDTISCRVLDLIDKEMLLENPEHRLNLQQLCDKLEEISILARNEYQQSLERNRLSKVEQTTLKALLTLDKQAPATATQVGMTHNAILDSSSEQGPASLSPISRSQPQLHPPSARVRKSELLDKIYLGKTANREEAIKSDLGLTSETQACEIFDSPPHTPSTLGKHTFREQASVTNELYESPTSIKGKGKEIEIPEIRLTGDNQPIAHERMSQFHSEDDRVPFENKITQVSPRDTRPHSSSDEDEVVRNGIKNGFQGKHEYLYRNDDKIMDYSENRVQKRATTSQLQDQLPESSSTNQVDYQPHYFNQPTSILPTHAQQINSRTNSGFDDPRPPDRQSTSSNNPNSVFFQDYQIPEIYQEHQRLKSVWGEKRGVTQFWRKIPEDPYLKNFILNRDIVIDSKSQMLESIY